MKSLFVALTAAVALATTAPAQELAKACTTAGAAAGGTAVKRQPRIIVVPFTKSNEDIRTVLEADVKRRIAITKMQEAFDLRGFSAGDFIGIMRSLGTRTAGGITAQSDLLSQVFEAARADIYVEVEVNIEKAGDLQSAVAIMRGYLTANGLSLGNKIGRSPKQQMATDSTRLVEISVGTANVDPLLDLMQEKFNEYNENGVPITVDITTREGAKLKPGSDVPGKTGTLGDLIEDWMQTHAWKGVFDLSKSTETTMGFDEVRIPMLDPATCRNYNASRLGRELTSYLRTLGVTSSASTSGGSLLIELR